MDLNFYQSASSTMNYFFLRFATKQEELSDHLKEELAMFLVNLSTEKEIPAWFIELAKEEMDAGDYLSDKSEDEINHLFSEGIERITGENNDTLTRFYMGIANEILH